MNNYLFKGSLAGVDGRIQSRSYENQEGRRIFVTEVVADSVQFLEPKNAQGGQRNQSNNNDFQDYGQDLVVNNQDKIHLTITIIHQIINNLIIHLQTQTDRLILVMMTYHSNNKMNV